MEDQKTRQAGQTASAETKSQWDARPTGRANTAKERKQEVKLTGWNCGWETQRLTEDTWTLGL
jgi:hypothetical protein